jgi:hypothetical protein
MLALVQAGASVLKWVSESRIITPVADIKYHVGESQAAQLWLS